MNTNFKIIERFKATGYNLKKNKRLERSRKPRSTCNGSQCDRFSFGPLIGDTSRKFVCFQTAYVLVGAKGKIVQFP